MVEVADIDEALAWADADVLQLEKFATEQVAEVVAAAGGVNASNAEADARAGARLLVTTAPH